MELRYYQYKIGSCKVLTKDQYEIEIIDACLSAQNPFWRVLLEVLSGQISYPVVLKQHLLRGLHLSPNSRHLLLKEFSVEMNHGAILKLSVTKAEETDPLIETYYNFYATKHPFSQWHKCTFDLDGFVFNSAEQYMMYSKALLFDDRHILEKVLQSNDVKEQKMLGRQVKNFDLTYWNSHALDFIVKGNLAKFTQNESMKDLLLSTKGKTLVEAAPTDFVWGVGLGEDDPLIGDIHNWTGTNWLGIALTEVREQILRG